MTLGEDWAGQLLVITAVTATVRIILVASIFETLTSGKILDFLILQLIILTRASWWLRGKNLPVNAGDTSLIPESGRSHGEGNGNPLQ